MKVGDLVVSSLVEGEYGIIVDKQEYKEQISGFLSKRHLYTVSWSDGMCLVGFREWELEIISYYGARRSCKS